LDKPNSEQPITSHEDFFRLFPGTYVVSLENRDDLFLVVVESQKPFFGALFGTQGILTFFTVGMAFLMSISFIYLYLKKKSIEASAVLLRLERGDLKARFEIKRFDEMPGLMVDFNRMAGEIERLVTRIRTAEASRKELLQELGHDLKTPLTALRTSFETLKTHNARMSDADREELFQMIEAEIKYFGDLVEKLMTIASLDEPNFKAETESIDIKEMLSAEIKTRQSNSPLTWSLIAESGDAPKPLILGDPHLILRMVKNAFDNSSRYAKSLIDVEILEGKNEIEIRIRDDGPGLGGEDLELFAKRRGRRTRRAGEGLNFSLGLGSVIMKSIAELHGGRLQIKNDERVGAVLSIWLPKFQNET
jgi:K+-sensing histidine kinase KdpD